MRVAGGVLMGAGSLPLMLGLVSVASGRQNDGGNNTMPLLGVIGGKHDFSNYFVTLSDGPDRHCPLPGSV